MQDQEVVTITGAAGGTGLAAVELCLSRNHPVYLIIVIDQTICVVRGQQQYTFLEKLIKDYYPHSTVTIIDSLKTPQFRDLIKQKYVNYCSFEFIIGRK